MTGLSFFLVDAPTRAESTAEAMDSPQGSVAEPELTSIGPDPALSLAEAVQRAARVDPDWGVVEARREEGLALRSASRRWLNGAPALSGSMVTDAVGQDDGFAQWNTGLTLPLWWPGQVAPRRRAADAAAAAAQKAPVAHALSVAGGVRAALADLAMSQARLDLARADHETEAALVARVERGVALGEIAERELLLVQSTLVDLELIEMEALEELEHARATWHLITGLEVWPAVWQETLIEGVPLESHPALRLARDDAERLEAEATRARRDRWGAPSLMVGSQHERILRSEDWDHRLQAGLSIPIGRADPLASGQFEARRAAVEARRLAARLERDLRAERIHSEHRLDLARVRLEKTARRRDLAVEHLARIERGFALGEVDLSALLEARRRSRRAVWARREAELLHHILIGRANQALGVVP